MTPLRHRSDDKRANMLRHRINGSRLLLPIMQCNLANYSRPGEVASRRKLVRRKNGIC